MFPIKNDQTFTSIPLETVTPSKKHTTEEEKADKVGQKILSETTPCQPEKQSNDTPLYPTCFLYSQSTHLVDQHLDGIVGKIPEDEREYFANIASLLFTEEMGELDKEYLLRAILAIPKDERTDVISHALFLFTHAMNGYDRGNLLAGIYAIPHAERAEVTKHANFLFRFSAMAMSGFERRYLLAGIHEIPQGERLDVIRLALLLFTNAMSGFDKRHLLGKILAIPQAERANLVNLGIGDIPQADRADVINHAWPLFTDVMDGEEKKKLLLVIGDIPQADRADVINHAKPLFTDMMDGWEKGNLLQTISGIPQAERADVINHAKPLFTDMMNGNDKGSLLQAIRGIPQAERADVTNHAKPLFTDMMNGWNKGNLLLVIRAIPQAERADVINHAKPLFTDVMNGWEKRALLLVIRDIPLAERADVINHAWPLFRAAISANTKISILKLIQLISPSERVDTVQTIEFLSHKNRKFLYKTLVNVDFMNCISKEKLGGFIRRIIRDFSAIDQMSDLTQKKRIGNNRILFFYLLMDYLSIKEVLPHKIQHFLENPQYRTALITALEREFAANGATPEMLLELARFVDSHKDTMWLHEEHTLVQQTIEILSLQDVENEKSPFTLYKKLKSLSSCPSTFEPPLCTVAKVTTSFCLKKLQSSATAFRLLRNELPRAATYEAWQSLINGLKKKVELNEKAHSQLATYGTSWDELWNGCFSDSYLSTLLRYSNENVSIVEAQFRAILRSILAQENTLQENTLNVGQIFSAQDEVLIKTAMNIKNCVGGKNEAIAKIYQILDPEYRYHAKGFETGDANKDAAYAFIAEEVQKLFIHQCSGTNALMQELTQEDAEVQEAPHQAIYLKNIIGPIIGLHHEVIFDRHTGMLYDSLVKKTREEVLEIFFRHMTPQVLVNELVKLTNNNPKVKKHLSAFIENTDEADLWDLCDDGFTVKATELAIVGILRKLGYLK